MFNEYFELGTTPSGESCQQVPYDNPELARKEARAFINQLVRTFGDVPVGACFKIKSFPHDFGSYYEVCIYYTEGDYNEETGECEETESQAYAYKVEAGLPEFWDLEAKKELGITENELSERS